jgi:hypothetical protein
VLLWISLHNYLHSASTSLSLSRSSHYHYNFVPKRLEFGFSPSRCRIKRLNSSVSADIGCPTRYRTRHFFNNFSTNEDIATKQTRTTDTFLLISHTTNVLLFKFRCNIFIGVRIIKEMPGAVESGTRYIITTYSITFSGPSYLTLHVLRDSVWLSVRGNVGRLIDKTS